MNTEYCCSQQNLSKSAKKYALFALLFNFFPQSALYNYSVKRRMFMLSLLDILKTALQTKAFLKNQSVYVLGKISSLQCLALHN